MLFPRGHLTKRQLEILQQMAAAHASGDWEEAEIVGCGLECWLGGERVSRRTVEVLVSLMLVKEEAEPGCTRWPINSIGLRIAKEPELVPELFRQILSGGEVTIY